MAKKKTKSPEASRKKLIPLTKQERAVISSALETWQDLATDTPDEPDCDEDVIERLRGKFSE